MTGDIETETTFAVAETSEKPAETVTPNTGRSQHKEAGYSMMPGLCSLRSAETASPEAISEVLSQALPIRNIFVPHVGQIP